MIVSKPHTPEISPLADAETAAVILPGENGGVDLIVDPRVVPSAVRLKEEFRNGTANESRLSHMEFERCELEDTIEKSLNLRINGKTLLPISVLDTESKEIYLPDTSYNVWKYEDEPDGEIEKIFDQALYKKPEDSESRYRNVTGHFVLHLDGPARRLHDPLLPEYLGAILADESKTSDIHEEKQLVFEDRVSRKHEKSIVISDPSIQYNAADELTKEHQTGELAEAILEDRNEIQNKVRRAARFIVEKVRSTDWQIPHPEVRVS